MGEEKLIRRTVGAQADTAIHCPLPVPALATASGWVAPEAGVKVAVTLRALWFAIGWA